MQETESQQPSIGTAKVIAAVLVALGLWELLVAVASDVLAPWAGALLGQNPSLPLTFTKNYDYADLALSAFELILAALLAALIHYLFSPAKASPRKVSLSPAPEYVSNSLIGPTLTAEPRRVEVQRVPLREETERLPVREEVIPASRPQPAVFVEPPVAPPVPPAPPVRAVAPPPAPSMPPARTVAPQAPPPQPPPPVRSSPPMRAPVASPHDNVRVEPPRPVVASQPQPPPPPSGPFWVPPPAEVKVPPPAPVVKPVVESKPEPPPPPSKKKKEKQVYYNLVGDPVMDDDD